eukprot:177050_1
MTTMINITETFVLQNINISQSAVIRLLSHPIYRMRWPSNLRMFYLRHLVFTLTLDMNIKYAYDMLTYWRDDNYFLSPIDLNNLTTYFQQTQTAIAVDKYCGYGGLSDKIYVTNYEGAKLLFDVTFNDFKYKMVEWVQLAHIRKIKKHHNDPFQTEAFLTTVIQKLKYVKIDLHRTELRYINGKLCASPIYVGCTPELKQKHNELICKQTRFIKKQSQIVININTSANEHKPTPALFNLSFIHIPINNSQINVFKQINNSQINVLKKKFINIYHDIPGIGLYAEPNHKLIYCSIPKNACTKFKLLYYALMHSMNVTKVFPKNIQNDVMQIYTWLDHNRMHMYKDFNKQFLASVIFSNSSWKTFVVIRDPLERLVSGFLDKCITDKRHWCEGEKLNVSQFHLFVERIIHKINQNQISKINDHFRPQFSYCGLNVIYPNFVDYKIIYNKRNIAMETMNLLKTLNLQSYFFNWGQYFNQTLFSSFTHHSTRTGSNLTDLHFYKQFYDQKLLYTAQNAYKKDYELFNLSFPDWMKHI